MKHRRALKLIREPWTLIFDTKQESFTNLYLIKRKRALETYT